MFVFSHDQFKGLMGITNTWKAQNLLDLGEKKIDTNDEFETGNMCLMIKTIYLVCQGSTCVKFLYTYRCW